MNASYREHLIAILENISESVYHWNQNCGGACVKAGQAQWALLLRVMPDRYRENEEEEEATRAIVGDFSILRDRRGGEAKILTLKQFRERIERQGNLGFDKHEWGGCGCAIE